MNSKFLDARNLSYVWKSNDLFNREKEKTLWTIPELKIEQPGLVLLAGRNGSGKSTLLRCLLGLMKPTSGDILWFGERNQTRGLIGYLPELPVLPGRVKVAEIIKALLGLTPAEFKAREQEMANNSSLKISELLDRQAQLLSKGQQQKLLLTLASAGSPKGYVLDEPFSGLDPWARAELADTLVRLAEQGHFLLISSHDAPPRLRSHVRESWIIEDQTLNIKPDCAIPE